MTYLRRFTWVLTAGFVSASVSTALCQDTSAAWKRTVAAGEVVYDKTCASCHSKGLNGAPAMRAIQVLTPATIYDAITKGRMRIQAANLTDQQRKQVVAYITHRPLEITRAKAVLKCTPNANWFDKTQHSAGIGWGADLENSRLVPTDQAQLKPGDLASLTLKWAFAFPGVSSAQAQALVAGGAVYVGSGDGTFFALDAATGCTRWTYKATGEILGGSVMQESSSGTPLILFADRFAYVYGLNAMTGEEVWKVKADSHPTASIIGTPALADGRVFVPVISVEEPASSSPMYPCCTFRGSITTLDAQTGKLIWRRYAIKSTPKERFKNVKGVPQYSPSGAAVWGAPAIDRKRNSIYFLTGNSYSEPATDETNAIFAIDLTTGKPKWHTQTMANDNWNLWATLCKDSMPEACSIKHVGPDVDLATAPTLVRGKNRKDILIAGRKDGIAYGVDPDNGKILWSGRVTKKEGVFAARLMYGVMAEGDKVFITNEDSKPPSDGGLYAINAFTGKQIWRANPADDCPRAKECTGTVFAPIGFPGAVFVGDRDGYVRAHASNTGKILWRFDTRATFPTVNGDSATGGTVSRNSIGIGHGMVFVGSGYGSTSNAVLLAFAPKRTK